MDSNEQQRWERYLYPGTSVLRNKFGITHFPTLHNVEKSVVFSHTAFLTARYDGQSEVTLREEISRIHAELFAVLYEHAGQFRDVDMTKEMPHAPGEYSVFLSYTLIPESLDQIDTAVRAYQWDSASFDEKTQMLAKVHAMLDYVHPFREGNGRSTRIIMENLAKANGIALDWSAVPPYLVILSSAEIFRQTKARSIRPLEVLYQRIASPRT